MSAQPVQPPRLPVTAALTLGVVHRTNSPALRAALAELPAWIEVATTLTRLEETAPPRENYASVEVNVAAIIVDALRSDDAVPADIHDKAAEAHAWVNSRTAVQAGVEAARAELAADLDSAVWSRSAVLFASLHAQLADVVQTVSGLRDNLGSLATAETAVAADRVAEYRQLQEAGARYADVRAAQGTLTRALAEQDARFPEALLLRDVVGLFPEWVAWRRYGFLIDPRTRNRRPLQQPWPQDDTKQRPLAAAGKSLEFLVWAVSNDAPMWVPDLRQLDTELARLALLHDGPSQSRAHVQRSEPEAEFVSPGAA